jgi:glycosyl transferase family 87
MVLSGRTVRVVDPASGSFRVATMLRAAIWVVLVAVSIVVWAIVFRVLGFAPMTAGSDAWNYLAAGERLNAGHALYALSPGDRVVFLAPPYWTVPLLAPPPVAVAWRPLALLGEPAMVLWGVGALIATVAVTIPLLIRGGGVVAGIIAVMSPSLAIQALAGNVNGFLLGALVLVWLLRDHPKIAGGLLAVAIAVKLTPVVVLVWAVGSRQWRLVAGSVGGLVVIGAVSLLGGGLQNHLDWLASVPASVPSPTSIAGLLGIPSTVVLVACAVVALAVGYRADDRVGFSVAVVAAALASPALYLGTLGIAAAAAAPWLRRRGEPAPWRGLTRRTGPVGAAPALTAAPATAAPTAPAPSGPAAGATDGGAR